MAAGVRERAQDQRPLELLLQAIADRALAARERLRRARGRAPAASRPRRRRRLAARRRRGSPAAGRRPRSRCPGAITVSQWQMFSSCRTLPGNGNAAMHLAAPRRRGRFGSTARSRALFCRKWRASGAMSSWRSRSGGSRRRTTLSRCIRSSRNSPWRTRSSRFWCVAAITRTLAFIGAWPPTR